MDDFQPVVSLPPAEEWLPLTSDFDAWRLRYMLEHGPLSDRDLVIVKAAWRVAVDAASRTAISYITACGEQFRNMLPR